MDGSPNARRSRRILMAECDEYVNAFLEHLRDTIKCWSDSERTWLTLPFQFADGDNVEVAVRRAGGLLMVSDLGETLRLSASVGFDPTLAPVASQLFERIREQFDVEMANGALGVRASQNNLGAAILSVTQTVLATRSLELLAAPRPGPSEIKEQLTEFFEARNFEYSFNKRVAGRSETVYHVTARVVRGHSDALIEAITPRSKNTRRGIVNRVNRMWGDLSTDDLKVTLIGASDTDLEPNDIRLLERSSNVVRWPQERDALGKLLVD